MTRCKEGVTPLWILGIEWERVLFFCGAFSQFDYLSREGLKWMHLLFGCIRLLRDWMKSGWICCAAAARIIGVPNAHWLAWTFLVPLSLFVVVIPVICTYHRFMYWHFVSIKLAALCLSLFLFYFDVWSQTAIELLRRNLLFLWWCNWFIPGPNQPVDCCHDLVFSCLYFPTT